ncbi:MAG: thiopurine S-methyltransferase [Bdellovibrionia bacterium]
MDAKFWHERWEQNNIGFHLSEANPLLVRYFDRLNLPKGARIFLPLCGKTRDIAWLLANGYRVVGAELSKLAIEQLFHELGVVPEIFDLGDVTRYSSAGIDIFVGDFFRLSTDSLGSVDAVYDRAALVALPEEMRHRYSPHLMQITNQAPQLLITYEYNQAQMDGPPFSISQDEVRKRYEERYHVIELGSAAVKMKGHVEAKERIWLLMGR